MNNIITPFKWYDKYHKQSRFEKDCSKNCDFELITDKNHLLPFQFTRTKSFYPVSKWILRPICDEPFSKLLSEADSNLVNGSHTWTLNNWFEYCGNFQVSLAGNGSVTKLGILTPTKTYRVVICVSEYVKVAGGTLTLNLKDGATTIGTILSAGVFEFTFTALTADFSLESIMGFLVGINDRIVVDNIQIYNSFSTSFTDITLDPNLLFIKNSGDVDYIMYCGFALGTSIPVGKYYSIMTYGTEMMVSEVITVKDFLPEKSPYIILEWWNGCDLADVLYQEFGKIIGGNSVKCSYKNRLYLEGPLTKPDYPFTEEGEQDGEQTFNPTFQKWEKKRILQVGKAPEFIIDSLTAIRLHDNIQITDPIREKQDFVDTISKVVSVEYDINYIFQDCFANVDLKMLLDTKIVDETCCLPIDIYECVGCPYFIESINDLNPMVGYALLFGYPTYDDGLYQWTGTAWVQIFANTLTVCSQDNTRKWYYNGDIWAEVPAIFVLTYFLGSIYIQGEALPGSWVRAEYSIDGGFTWIPVLPVITAEDFLSTGITFVPVAIPCCGSIRVRVKSFTLECDYGYSNFMLWGISDCC